MGDLINRQDAIDAVHHSIFDFFDVVEDDEESPITEKDKKLLELNKAICNNIKELPSAERTVAHIQDFIDYQTDWLTEHNDLELEPELEDWVIRFLQDTASCYQKEYLTAQRKGKWILHQDSRTWECSECHKYQVVHSEYCMHCGADMRGEQNEC